MRLFRVIIIFSSLFLLANCSSYSSQYTDNLRETDGQFINISKAPLNLNENIIGATPGFLWNATQYLRFSLTKDEKTMHRSAVYHALNNTINGEKTYWYSKSRKVGGVIRVIHTYPQSAGYCRVYQSFIKLNGATRHMTNNACKHMDYHWRFVK